jgi:hypothetical protein
MKRVPWAVLLLAAAGCSLAAAESDEPLAGVKQELKQLKADSSAQKSGVGDAKLKSTVPSVVIQPQSLPTTDAPNSARKRQSEKDLKDLKKQQDAEKNWLVREYEKLESEEGAARGDSSTKAPAALTEEKSEREQLQDLLSANDPKGREGRTPASTHSRTEPPRASDPFAPFMKEWLANSPVSGPLAESLGRSSVGQGPGFGPGSIDPAPAAIAPIAGRDLSDFSSTDAKRARAAVATTPQNPFLPGLDLPGLHESLADARQGPTSDVLAPVLIPPAKSPLIRVDDPTESAKRNTVAPPASKLSEDKKYFPQQKRF